MADNKTTTTIQLALHITGKNREETANNMALAQLQNNVKHSVGFDYETHWFNKKEVTCLYEVDIRHLKANSPVIKGVK